LAQLNTIISPGSLRQIILQQSLRAHVGHVGSALSVVEIVACLFNEVLAIKDPADPERDRFVLSKGHAALALYGALALRGWISQAELSSFCANGTLLGVHPEHRVRGIDFSTGSLGQGLSYAVGAALSAKKQSSSRKAYVLISDAECNEGAVWESAMFAAHHQLDNLIVIVDNNAQQAFGYTKDVLDLEPLQSRWSAFNWDVAVCDGHDIDLLQRTISGFSANPGKPHILIAQTTFGKGVSFMEGQIKWHYCPVSEHEYLQACEEVEALARK